MSRRGSGGVHQGENPHQGQDLLTAGTDLDDAEAALVLVHGRGATAQSIVQMGQQLHREGVALLAPQAAQRTWYPNSFLEPVDSNEPGRTSGLQAIADAIGEATEAGIPAERVLILGFSQGACLGSEFVARNPRRYGGLVAFSGGLIGQAIDPADYTDVEERLDGTPAFLGCSDRDPHIPEERVHATADVLEDLDADVETRIYEGMGHGVNEDEIEYATAMVESLVTGDE